MSSKTKKKSSFARRLTLRVILAVVAANILTGAAVLLFVVSGTAHQSKEHYQDVIDYTNEMIEATLNIVEVIAINNVNEIENNLGSPEQVYKALEKELKMNPYVMGYFSAFEADFFPQQGRWFEPYVVRRDSNRLEKVQVGSEHHDYLQREWYKKGLVAEKGYWSEPYFDDDGAHAMLCSYVLPIHNKQGKTVGIFGVDLPIDWLSGQIEVVNMKENERIFSKNISQDDNDTPIRCLILGRNGQYIVHPDKDKILTGNFIDDSKLSTDVGDDIVCKEMLAGKRDVKEMVFNDMKCFVYYAPIGHAGWSMAIVVPWLAMYFWGIVIGVLVFFIMLLGVILIAINSMVVVRRNTKPLRFLSSSADKVAQGNFDAPLPNFKYNDEICQLRDSFETMQLSLSKYVEELKSTTASKATMDSELRIAHSIQMSMLPKTFPPFPERDDIDIFGQIMPAKAVGGDLYDFFIRDEKLFFCIGDVSGKGVPASLVMAVTRSLFRNIAAHNAKPDQILTALNESLSEGNEANMFVTLFVGVLDLPTGRLHYCNAGHDAPLLFSSRYPSEPNCSFYKLPVLPNLPVGAMPGVDFVPQEIVISYETSIFLYTDGLTEAENAEHSQFGLQRISKAAENAKQTPKGLIDAMTEAVHQFVGNTEQSDDLTMLAVRYTKLQLESSFEKSITLPNDVQEIPLLSEFVDNVCETVGFDMATTMNINLAIEEAVVNVMNYAYPAGEQGEVSIKAVANKHNLKFIICDNGIPFDPTAQKDVDITLPSEEREIGGLGIHLVRTIMDSINYERVNGQNVFTLRKNF